MLPDWPQRSAGQEAARAWLRQRAARRATAPTAVVCSEAGVARGAIEEIRRGGAGGARRRGVVATDGTQACTDEEPSLTAAAANPAKLGEAAVEWLTNFPEATEGEFPRTVVPATFTPGATTARAERTAVKPDRRDAARRRLADMVSAFGAERLTG